MAVPEADDNADSVPQATPLHPAPDNTQVTPLLCASLVTVAVKFCGWLVCTLATVGATLTATGGVTVIVAAELLVLSATEVAVSVTVAGLGTVEGALYVTEVVVTPESVPQAVPLHPAPDSPQVTPLLCVSFCSEAVKPCVPIPACTLGALGLTVTLIAWSVVMVTVAAEILVLSATEVAEIVTVAGLGTTEGAV